MKTNTKKAGTAITVVNICVILLCAVLTLLLLIPTAYNMLSKEDKPIFGRYLYVNVNNSLEPVMKTNDIIAVMPTPLEQMAVGDFLCYYPIGEQKNGVQFGKIIAIDGDNLALSDKLGHSVEVVVGDIVTVGKATDKILLLGQLVHSLKDGKNRLIFYIILAVAVAALLGLVIALHIKQLRLYKQSEEVLFVPRRYSLDELIEVETEPIQFERAAQREEYLR